MASIISKLIKKTILCQSREVIHKVHGFMRTEADAGTPIIPLNKYNRVVQATGVSERNLRRILGESSLCEEQ
ncbi:hypothetical protein C0J52_21620 [Blattella germanica]|nr:hypothetical protein C0J52_21620 [Blattella germanica]